ncbi:MAG TPA: rRNA maturation RNase YbeY [Candidatus Methylacidiphilales bacterium]
MSRSSNSPRPPRVDLFNLQSERRVAGGAKALARRIRTSIEFLPARGNPLPPRVEISLVTAAEIARVHGEFMDDPTPTDVITFDHGDILVCPLVAEEQGRDHGRTMEEELLLYGIHGLLHIQGWSDLTPKKRAAMHKEQERVFQAVLASEKKAAGKAKKAPKKPAKKKSR